MNIYPTYQCTKISLSVDIYLLPSLPPYLHIHLSIYEHVCLSIDRSICPSIYISLSIHPSIHPSICLSVCISVCFSVCLSVCAILAVSLHAWVCICLSLYQVFDPGRETYTCAYIHILFCVLHHVLEDIGLGVNTYELFIKVVDCRSGRL